MSSLYAFGQLVKSAFVPRDKRCTDEENAAKSAVKVERWRKVLEGMRDGSIKPGKRNPTSAPDWVTLDVANGGFATGGQSAGRQDGDKSNDDWFTAEGLAELRSMLATGKYRIDHAEEGILLAFVWLLDHGAESAAEELQDIVAPYWDKLRYYPRAADTPITVTPATSVLSVAEVKSSLHNLLGLLTVDPSKIPRLRAEESFRSAITIVNPWRRRLLRHFSTLSNVEARTFKTEPVAAKGAHCQAPKAKRVFVERRPVVAEVVGDGAGDAATKMSCVPLQYPASWVEDTQALAKEWKWWAESAEGKDVVSLHHRVMARPNSHFVWLVEALTEAAASEGGVLSKRAAGRVVTVLTESKTLRGAVGSESFEAWWDEVGRALPLSPIPDVKAAIAGLEGLQDDAGIPPEKLDAIVSQLPAKSAAVLTILQRGCETTIRGLIEMGVISSAEGVGAVLPNLVGFGETLKVRDSSLQRLLYATRLAFAKRRGVMIIGRGGQVKMDDLPWVKMLITAKQQLEATGSAEVSDLSAPTSEDAGVKRGREGADDNEEKGDGADGAASYSPEAMELLVDIVACTLESYPATILPNKFLQGLRDLSAAAGSKIVVTEELASDLFMWDPGFGPKYTAAAVEAAEMLKGSVYEKYYSLATSFGGMSKGAQAKGEAAGRGGSSDASPSAILGTDLYDICTKLAAARSPGARQGAAQCGTEIEQGMIMTTHNLARVFKRLELVESGAVDVAALASKAGKEIVSEAAILGRGGAPWKTTLQRCKNIGYAVRQFVFYVSLLKSEAEQRKVVDELNCEAEKEAEALGPQGPVIGPHPIRTVQKRVVERLRACLDGSLEDDQGVGALYGWTTSHHPLLPPKP